jgi:hypothetical protein
VTAAAYDAFGRIGTTIFQRARLANANLFRGSGPDKSERILERAMARQEWRCRAPTVLLLTAASHARGVAACATPRAGWPKEGCPLPEGPVLRSTKWFRPDPEGPAVLIAHLV